MYASQREEVEEKIMRWHENYGESIESSTGKAKAPYKAVPEQLISAPSSSKVSSDSSFALKNEIKKKPLIAARPDSIFKAAPQAVVKDGHEAICSECGQKTVIAFIPDGVRPVYCRECLSKKKEEKRLELENRRVAKEKEKLILEKSSKEVDVPAISLSALKDAKPIDWRGREIKKKIVVPDNYSALKNSYEEKDLLEGEDVIISNNNF